MKDRNYWLERGKNGPIKEGFICLGNGDDKESLVAQESNFQGNLLAQYVDKLDHWMSYRGDVEGWVYYIETKTFNNIFPDKTKQEKLAELLAEAEKLKQEIAQEENRFKVGDILFAEEDSFGMTYIFKVSRIQSDGYFAKNFFSANALQNCQEDGLFPFSSYRFTKIEI